MTYEFPTLATETLSRLPVAAILFSMVRERLVHASLRTDQGRVRSNNQDFVACREPSSPAEEKQNGWLYILADGAGGMDAGDVASQYATEQTLKHYLEMAAERDWGGRLSRAMQAANRDLRELGARKDGNSRMATTMVATVIAGDRAHVANVGDSRAYLFRNGRLKQITKDQSLVAQLMEEGAITAEEAANHPRRNVILYSLGSEKEPRIDLFALRLRPADKLLVCSDGLTRHVKDHEIAAVLDQQSPPEASETLIKLANERGGQDNISVGIIELIPERASSRVVSVAQEQEVKGEPANSKVLWSYTVILSIVQSALMLIVWYLLRV